MTVFTRTWNAAYEASPAGSDLANTIDNRMRDTRLDVRERLSVDHSMAGDVDDGAHKKVTLLEQAADPTLDTDTGFVYTKDDGAGATELYYMDDSGNVVQLTRAGDLANIAAGTKMLFQQTAAPAGWTKDATHNDKALRVVSGAASSGGSKAFTTTFGAGNTTDSHTLLEAEIPSHTHGGIGLGSDGAGGVNASWRSSSVISSYSTDGGTGGGGGHTHPLSNFDLQYVDIIIATKD